MTEVTWHAHTHPTLGSPNPTARSYFSTEVQVLEPGKGRRDIPLDLPCPPPGGPAGGMQGPGSKCRQGGLCLENKGRLGVAWFTNYT